MDALDGRRSSRALGSLLILAFLSAAAVASYTRYEVNRNRVVAGDESTDAAHRAPLVRYLPSESDVAADEEAEAVESPASENSVRSPTVILSI